MLLKPVSPRATVRLTDAEAKPPARIPDGELQDTLRKLLTRMNQLQDALYAEGRRALLVVLQGRDAAGKDGTIRHVFGALDPQGCQVSSFRQPSEEELSHDFLWRIHRAVPPHGIIGVFNRSHYEDVLVVRVKRLVPQAVWSTRYEQINDFERMLSASGTAILKFFLHISRAEQKQRLVARLKNPKKNWKFRVADLDDRALWDEYARAYQDALSKCSTGWAPWYVVPSNKKRVRNYLVARVVVDTLERMAPEFPPADPDLLRHIEKID